MNYKIVMPAPKNHKKKHLTKPQHVFFGHSVFFDLQNFWHLQKTFVFLSFSRVGVSGFPLIDSIVSLFCDLFFAILHFSFQ